jgi:hypothetical protein
VQPNIPIFQKVIPPFCTWPSSCRCIYYFHFPDFIQFSRFRF